MNGSKANVEVYCVSRALSGSSGLTLLPPNCFDSIASKLAGSEVPKPREPTTPKPSVDCVGSDGL